MPLNAADDGPIGQAPSTVETLTMMPIDRLPIGKWLAFLIYRDATSSKRLRLRTLDFLASLNKLTEFANQRERKRERERERVCSTDESEANSVSQPPHIPHISIMMPCTALAHCSEAPAVNQPAADSRSPKNFMCFYSVATLHGCI